VFHAQCAYDALVDIEYEKADLKVRLYDPNSTRQS